MIDLAQAAAGNASRIESNFRELIEERSAEDGATIVTFSEWVLEVCRVSINVKLYVVFDLINNGRYLNMYDAAMQYAEVLGTSREEILRSWLRAFFDRRIAFDRAFKDGEELIYGALTAGSGGLREYDPYCLTLSKDFHATAAALAYLPGDSVNICFSAHGEFDEGGTCAMLAPDSHRHMLAACKNWRGAITSAKADWPALMNQKATYFEALFKGVSHLQTLTEFKCCNPSMSE